MLRSALLPIILLIMLAATSAVLITSRNWHQESHRELMKSRSERRALLDEEQTLKVEWVFRTDLNSVERRAREELGMQAPRPGQWHVVAEP